MSVKTEYSSKLREVDAVIKENRDSERQYNKLISEQEELIRDNAYTISSKAIKTAKQEWIKERKELRVKYRSEIRELKDKHSNWMIVLTIVIMILSWGYFLPM